MTAAYATMIFTLEGKQQVSSFKKTADLPLSVRLMVRDEEGREIFRQAFNAAAADGRSLIGSYGLAWGALLREGYRQNPKTGHYRRP